jgi:hypothetical protein
MFMRLAPRKISPCVSSQLYLRDVHALSAWRKVDTPVLAPL